MSMKEGHTKASQREAPGISEKQGVPSGDTDRGNRPLDDAELEGVVGGTGNDGQGLLACDLENYEENAQNLLDRLSGSGG